MNELKIEVPQGMIIDTENSSLTKGIIKFKPIEKLPKTWDEFCEQNRYVKTGESFITQSSGIKTYEDYDIVRDSVYYKNVLPNRETAEAVLALIQLIQLRDCYNDKWKPDWECYNNKHCIINTKNVIKKSGQCNESRILTFKTEELRDKFFENFHDLIETAKELI